MDIPENLTREDILSGIQRFEREGAGRFKDSIRYDLLFEGKRFPPKAVLGLSTYRLLGGPLKPSDFTGGEESTCFRILRRLGFQIVAKKEIVGWIFQGNPDKFDIEGYIKSNDEILWYIGQEHHIKDMAVGQPVYFWKAKGTSEEESGVIAAGEIIAVPEQMQADEASFAFGRKGYDPGEVIWRARLRVTRRRLGKDLLKSSWLRQDPILRDLRILKQAAGTNYPISAGEQTRLRQLMERTGEDFDERDSTIALLAYAKTYGGELSQKPGSPIAEAALLSGRVITSVYNKVLNFRSIDPRDARKGLDGGSGVDEAVWARYYDPEKKELLITEIQAAVFAEKVSVPAALKRLEDLIEAPDDDTTVAQQTARKIRRGQPRFRKNLLRIHDGRCAVTGTAVESVLEACHISPHSSTGTNHTSNGILLRSDIHDLFDDYLITFDTDLIIRTSPALRGTEYARFNGTRIGARDSAFPIATEYVLARNQRVPWLTQDSISKAARASDPQSARSTLRV